MTKNITIMNNKRCNIALGFSTDDILFGLGITNFNSVVSLPIVLIRVGVGFIDLHISYKYGKSRNKTDARRLCPEQPTIPSMPKEVD